MGGAEDTVASSPLIRGEPDRDEEADEAACAAAAAAARARAGLGGARCAPDSGVSPARGVDGEERLRERAIAADAEEAAVPFCKKVMDK